MSFYASQPLLVTQAELGPKRRTGLLTRRGVVFNVACQDSHPTAYYRGIFRVNLRDHHTQRKVQQYAIRKDLDFCRWNLDCAECARSRSKSVHYAHLDCYKLAYNLYPALSLDHLELIAKFGSTVLPGVMMPPSPPAPTANGHQIFFSNKRNQGTELGQLMATVIGQLPIELQHMIWSHTGALLKSISTCIWNLHHQFRPYLTADIDKYPEVSSFPLSVGPKIERLGVKMINILGEDTIAEIGTGAQDWHHHISVANVKVNALQTSFGTHGLVAVRVLYEDGSKSPWVGGHSRKWFRTCKGSDLKRMRVTFDVSISVGMLVSSFTNIERGSKLSN